MRNQIMTQTPPSLQEQIDMRALLLACTPQAIEWRKVCAQVTSGGHIRRSGVLFVRSMGNDSLSPCWTGA